VTRGEAGSHSRCRWGFGIDSSLEFPQYQGFVFDTRPRCEFQEEEIAVCRELPCCATREVGGFRNATRASARLDQVNRETRVWRPTVGCGIGEQPVHESFAFVTAIRRHQSDTATLCGVSSEASTENEVFCALQGGVPVTGFHGSACIENCGILIGVSHRDDSEPHRNRERGEQDQ
jgi:hypothetical protein